MKKSSHSKPIFILIGPKFDEITAVSCLSHMRAQSLTISLVGLLPGPLRGQRGLLVCPDLSLAELESRCFTSEAPPLLIIPGSYESAALLLTDPRVHQICKNTLKLAGVVAAFQPAQRLLAQSEIGRDETGLLVQDGMETAVFVQHLIQFIK